jgi:1A family penicillin-binding protein
MAVKRAGTVYAAKKLRSKQIPAPKFFGKTWQKPKTLFGWITLILELIGRPVTLGLIFSFQETIVFLHIGKLLVARLLFFIGQITLWFFKQTFFFLKQVFKLPFLIWSQFRARKPKPPKIKIPFKIIFPRLRLPRPRKKYLLLISLVWIIFLLVFVGYLTIIKDLPRPNQLITRDQVVSTKIYDRKGRLLYKIYRNQNRTLVKIEEIPTSLIQATVAIEDSEFYRHHGFSFRGITRSFFKNLIQGKLEGGSTITQQLVKNALLTPERSLERKAKELILSFQVELAFTKDEILQMYLNEVSYGGAAYGAEEAAWTYFGKSVRDLSLAESALLAGLPASPTTYSPFGAHPELAKARQWQVLRGMVENHFITAEQAEEAKAQELQFAAQRTNIRAPHFVMYVKDWLVQKYGERMVEEGGLEVKTSLDLDIQNFVQKAIEEEMESLAKLQVGNGAGLVTKPATGEILAMVGSKDYFDTAHDGNVNVTLQPRQPGSAIKPVNYSVALENGFTPATLLSDTPITYKIPGQPPYSPRNYDNQFHGQIPLRIALASSYNVPAVKVLSSYGVSKMIDRGQAMGITTWNERERFGLSLTLGGGEVKMVDMAVAFGTLANMGLRVDLNPILEVKNYKGEVLDSTSNQQPVTSNRVISPEVAYLLTDILSDNVARTPAFGPYSVLQLPSHPHVAVKTGTTQNLRDNWTIGYSPDYLAAVWVGNNDNTPMSYVASGITGASPIWHKIMSALLRDVPDKEFPRPDDLVKVEICPTTGTLPCEGCGGKEEYFLPGTEPKKHCSPETIREIKEKQSQTPTQSE